MLEGLKADLATIAKKMEETATQLQIMFGQKQGIEHAISKIEAVAPVAEALDPALTAPIAAVEGEVAKVEAVVDTVAPTEPVPS